MRHIFFEEKVRGINWTKYLAPEYYNSKTMDFNSEKAIEALIELNQYDGLEDDRVFDIGHRVRMAIGNDHRGTYYPAALEAIDLIIEIAERSDSAAARKLALFILNDWFYFQLELGCDNHELYEALEAIIREKLQPYSDENIVNS